MAGRARVMAARMALQQRSAAFEAAAILRKRARAHRRAGTLVQMMREAEEWALLHGPERHQTADPRDEAPGPRDAKPAQSGRKELALSRQELAPWRQDFWVHDTCVVCLGGAPQVKDY
ncbi:hypothetical protein WJX84_012248 [Apatococcus fuscideae]|uniref:Uncharacterized protein n=1 Tax=Apatococcus fuscideae TaxID=2026836 RepID=A0AAW1T4Y9_9CHLO